MTSVRRPCARRAHLREHLGIGRGAAREVGDARMLRIVVPHRLDVDRDDLALAEEVADRGEVERAAAAPRARLDDELRPRLRHDLLVDPEVERVLERLRAEPRRLRPRVRPVEDVVRAGRPRPDRVGGRRGRRDAERGRVRTAPIYVGRSEIASPSTSRYRSATSEIDGTEIAARRSSSSRTRRSSTSGSSSSSRNGTPGLADELGVAAALEERRRKPARKRLHEGVRAGVVAARGEVHVVVAQQLGDLAGADGPDGPDPLERLRRAPDERHLVALEVEVSVEPERACRSPCGGCPTSSTR